LRARAFALSILLIHLLGDAISPSIVGALSDWVGLPKAIGLVPIAMAVGAVIWLCGWRWLPPMRANEPEKLG
jgi:dipeptide/tripeptide permease